MHFASSHCLTLADDGILIQMPYMVETRLHSNGNNLELHEAGSASWVPHSNHLTHSNDSRIFLRKTRESKMAISKSGLEIRPDKCAIMYERRSGNRWYKAKGDKEPNLTVNDERISVLKRHGPFTYLGKPLTVAGETEN